MSRVLAAMLIGLGLTSAPVARADPPALFPLVDAATERLQTAGPVAASKWHTGGPITDPARVAVVLDAVRADAAGRGVDPDFVADVFTDQIDATESVEYSLFAHWKLDPAAVPASAPDLSASRAQIDRLNRTMVAEIARARAVLESRQCEVELDMARRDVAAQRGLDPLYHQALTFATRSYCDR